MLRIPVENPEDVLPAGTTEIDRDQWLPLVATLLYGHTPQAAVTALCGRISERLGLDATHFRTAVINILEEESRKVTNA